MVERFVSQAGTISIVSGTTTVTGTGTLFGGIDREAAGLWAYPVDDSSDPQPQAPILVGHVAAVEPRGVYDNLSLPLVNTYDGPDLVDVAYELVDGPAIANGTTQAAIYARFAAHMEQNMGLVGNTADALDYALVPNNSLFVDAVTRAIYQWRNGVLEPVFSIGLAFTPRGAWTQPDSDTDPFAQNDLVEHLGSVFVSNHADNDSEPLVDTGGNPSSDEHWTWLPLPSGAGDIFALSIAIGGKPLAAETIEGHVFADTITFPAGLTGSRAVARVAPTAEAEFSIRKNGVEVGTVTFPLGDTDGVLAAASEVVCTAGDEIDLVAPDPQDDTLSGVKITLRGSR
jgi:hypothetical protein